MARKLFYDVFGMYVLALWLLAEEIQPDDPQGLATRMLRKASTEYYEIPTEQLKAISEKFHPANWPPDESV